MRGYTTAPEEIEKESFRIISRALGERLPNEPGAAQILKRVIHTTADFDYVDTLYISPEAVQEGLAAIKEGCTVVTDTNMALAGINKTVLAGYGGKAVCFVRDQGIAKEAKRSGVTRAMVAMDKACEQYPKGIFVVGNAPTALYRLKELIEMGIAQPRLVVAVPVGFVGAEESKEAFMAVPVPKIVNRGRKGGSNVAAAIVNALLYMSC